MAQYFRWRLSNALLLLLLLRTREPAMSKQTRPHIFDLSLDRNNEDEVLFLDRSESEGEIAREQNEQQQQQQHQQQRISLVLHFLLLFFSYSTRHRPYVFISTLLRKRGYRIN